MSSLCLIAAFICLLLSLVIGLFAFCAWAVNGEPMDGQQTDGPESPAVAALVFLGCAAAFYIISFFV